MRIYARPIPDAKNAHKVKNDQGVHVALLSACVIGRNKCSVTIYFQLSLFLFISHNIFSFL